jgi:hypothetical protein
MGFYRRAKRFGLTFESFQTKTPPRWCVVRFEHSDFNGGQL